MEIPARGVRAQRPRRLMEALPRRQRQCVPEEEGDGLHGQRLRWHGPDRVELPVGKRAAHCRQWKANELRSRVPPKRIGLRRPVHIARRCGVPVEVVLCALVVGDDHLFGRGISFETTGAFQRTWRHDKRTTVGCHGPRRHAAQRSEKRLHACHRCTARAIAAHVGRGDRQTFKRYITPLPLGLFLVLDLLGRVEAKVIFHCARSRTTRPVLFVRVVDSARTPRAGNPVHNPRAPVQNGTAELSATWYSGRAFLTTKTMTLEVHHDRRQMDRLQAPVCPRCDSVSRVRPKFRTREQVYFHCVSCGQYMVELKPDHPPSPDMTLARAAPSH